jgi:phenylacetate-coenzyme A ligase PaaK-like adenylate-forming protein
MRDIDSPKLPERDADHDARAVRSIARAFGEIPFYAKRGDAIPSDDAKLEDVLARTPLLTKNHVRATLPKQWVPKGRDAKAELASGDLELVETSGSTSERLRILWDKGWWLHQEERAMRVNARVAESLDGKFGAYKEAILTTPVCGLGSCHTGELTFEERTDEHRLFLNMRPDPTFWKEAAMTRMIDEIARHQTIGLETDPAYFAALCRYAKKTNRTIDVRGFVQLTYAFTTASHVRAIRRAYDGPLYQLYGASEVGVLFMEGEDGLLHHAPYTTHIELLRCKVATPGSKDVALVVVTTMDRIAQPLIRFVIGDLVQVDWDGEKRLTSVPPLASVEGRVQDAMVRPDGALVTAGAIDRALASVIGLAMFQANQHTPTKIEVDVSPEDGSNAEDVASAARLTLAPLFEGMELVVRTATAIAAEPSGKFRTSRRHFAIDFARSFEGCDSIDAAPSSRALAAAQTSIAR